MLRSAQPSQFSTYPSQYIDTPGLAVLVVDVLCETGGHISMHYLITGTLFVRRLLTTAGGGMDAMDTGQ